MAKRNKQKAREMRSGRSPWQRHQKGAGFNYSAMYKRYPWLNPRVALAFRAPRPTDKQED